jgi:hypothetical protein
MKAIVVSDQAAGTAGMKLEERPEPQAAINDVVVRIHASGLIGRCISIWSRPRTQRAQRLFDFLQSPVRQGDDVSHHGLPEQMLSRRYVTILLANLLSKLNSSAMGSHCTYSIVSPSAAR